MSTCRQDLVERRAIEHRLIPEWGMVLNASQHQWAFRSLLEEASGETWGIDLEPHKVTPAKDLLPLVPLELFRCTLNVCLH